LHEGIQTGTTANMEAALAAGSRVIMAVAVEDLTAGAVDVYLEYVL
nr:hypothetical protein [Armatimonadota bacterium]NIO95551.1 hypothetical protein [Armatimonadota bacterium]